MWSQYDEDLTQNPFFKEIKENHADILEKASKEGWIICVPCKGSLKSDDFSVQTILNHVLVFDSDGQCESLSKNKVAVSEQCLVYQKNSVFQSEVSVLFKETHYVKETLKFSVWCVSHFLFNVRNNRRMSDNNNIVLHSLQDCIDFLYCENLLEHIRTLCDEFWKQHENTLQKDELQTQKDTIGILYSQCLQFCLKNDLLYTKEHYVTNVKVSVETYMQYCLGQKLMFILNTNTFFVDGILNKILRNSLHITMNDLNIPVQLQGKVLEVKNELSRINNFVTILDKLRVLQRIYESFSVNSDDFLPILVFLVLRSNISNWMSNLMFIKNFQFSLYDDYNQTSFLVTTLEAAISFIRSSQFLRIKNQKLCDDDFLTLYRQLNISKTFNQMNVKVRQENYCHPLCTCPRCSQISPAKTPVNIINNQGQNFLIYAAIDNNIDLLHYLLKQGFDINFKDYEGKTALHHTAQNGHQVILMLLLNASVNVNAQDNAKNTALHLASDRGWDSCVKALIYASAFAEVNLQNALGETALFNAVRWGFMDVCRILLENGASVCVKNNRGVTAYRMANNYYISELFNTFSRGRSVKLRKESQSSDEPVAMSKEHSTCQIDLLLKAIEVNDMQLTYFYLGYNNNPLTEDCTKELCHPLCNCTKCSQPIEHVQNQKHLNVNQANSEGLTPLHVASKYGRTEVLRILLDCGAHVNVTTKKTHQTPLHLAVMFQRTNAIKELLTCGDILIDPQDFKGNTPLFYACTLNNKNTKTVEMLLQNGADCQKKNVEDKTVLQACEEHNLFKICRILRQNLGYRVDEFDVGDFSDYVIL